MCSRRRDVSPNRHSWRLAALGMMCAIPCYAGAATARTTVSTDLVALVAPDGIVLTTSLLRHWDLADGDSVLLRGRYFETGISVAANPAAVTGGLFAEWVPVAPLQLRVGYDAYGFLGCNGALLRFPSSTSRFGKAEIDAAAGSETAGLGHRLLFTPTLRGELGSLLLQSQTDLAWYALSNREGWYYEMEYDTLLAKRDFLVSNRTTLLGELWRGGGEASWRIGPGYEVTYAGRAHIARERVEGVLFWSPTDRWGAIRRPRLLAIGGVDLIDRNRQGEPFALMSLGADVDF
ncbi:MAG TPA: hypothetical protein VMK12_30090 [Anaeromyxobacteraceae bacterium]|nr:hypothetical protein [Anaeromyxobacteraceae bacterium]